MRLNELERNGIIEKADERSEWVHHLVTVEKKDLEKTLRICIDPSELNKQILDEQSYLPTFEEFSASVNGMKYFSVLDLRDGFWHVRLAEESRNLCTFATPFGNYRYIRMPFGIKTGPKVFQRLNFANFGDIENVHVYFDDIFVVGKTKQEHDEALIRVLERAKEKNVRFNEKKMQIASESVKYLGHIFSFNKIEPDPERLEGIRKMTKPKNKKDLQVFMGVINFMRPFIANLSQKATVLRELLKKNVLFKWTEFHTKVFEDIKNDILTANILVPFDATKEIVIQCDASQDGLGCCLMQDGKPISFASRSLTPTEQNYSQIEKEMLSIVYACTKFNYFTYGRYVRIVNDHKPLLGIMQKDIHKIASAKLQRMRIKLLNYDVNLEYAPGKTIHIADYLSRYIDVSNEFELEEDTNITHAILSINVSDERKNEMQKETENDGDLRKVKEYCKTGWPADKKKCPESLRYLYKLKNEIILEDDLLFYNERVIIPKTMRKLILQQLHEPHFGITKTIERAKSSVYWPNINNDIEHITSRCRICQENAPKNRKEPMIPHEIPDGPFIKIACDILYSKGKDYLCVVDYYSKWIELIQLKDKTARTTNLELIKIFAQFGYPRIIIADNMPFGSFESKEFTRENDVKIINSSPNYAKSNGQAERSVQICKNILKKASSEHELYKSLLAYRTTPTKYMTYTPAQLMQSRNLRSNIPMHVNKFKPQICVNVEQQHERKQFNSKKYYDIGTRQRAPFESNEKVLFINNKKWQHGTIISACAEPRSYLIQSENRRFRRNSSHIKKFFENKTTNANKNNEQNSFQKPQHEHQRVTRSGRRY